MGYQIVFISLNEVVLWVNKFLLLVLMVINIGYIIALLVRPFICVVMLRHYVDKCICTYNEWLKKEIVIMRYACVYFTSVLSVYVLFYNKAVIDLSQERDFYKSQQVC